MIYKMELSDSTDTMVFDLLEVPIEDKDVTGVASNTTIDGNVFNDYLWLKKQYVQKWSIMCQDEYERLRGFWTRQFGNAEVPFYRLFYGDNVYEDKNFLTSDGMTQILNPTERTAPLLEYSLYGNAEQFTTTGKNLASIETSATKTIGGVAFTIVDGVLNISNGTTAGYTNFYFDSFRVPNSGASVLWLEVSGYTPAPSDNCVLMLQESADNSTWTNKAQQSWGSPTTQSITLDNTKYYRIRIYAPPSAVFNNAKAKFQLEYGSTKTDFEEYTAGASPNPDYPQDVNVVTGAQTVKITGKNLFDVDNATWISSNSTLTEDSGVFEMAAQSGKIAHITLPITKLVAGMTYVISFEVRATSVASSGANTYARLRELSNGGSWLGDNVGITASDVFSKKTITYTPTTITEPYLWFYLSPSASNTNNVDIFVKNIQVELGSTATTYEPYQEQSQEINLGKNLFDKDNANILNAYFTASSGSQALSADAAAKNKCIYIKCDPNTTYTAQKMEGKRFSLGWCSEQPVAGTSTVYGIVRDYTAEKLTITTGDTAKYLIAYIINLNEAGEITLQQALDTLQIERGSQATSYSAYFTPIELAKVGTYQDYIWNDNGAWKIHKEVGKVVYIGASSEAWTGNSYGGLWRAFITIPDIFVTQNNPDFEGISDHFYMNVGVLGAATIREGMFCQYRLTNQVYFAAPSSVTDNASFKTWLSTHNTTVYYALATPTDTEITDSELVEQLDAMLDAYLYVGQNNLSLIPSGGAQGEIAGEYRLIYEEETDIIPSTPAVLTLSDGGVINPCGCRQNIQLIMRETKEQE